ncbi:BamA/TamA family outer membrane protein [Aliifodinibius halophilus]|uniref:BamA/TamA family outer membrane protein n=2 Tax=Fodinibius halophilus TaxID=1736908 RepID=A0A6M1T122_9BACT|nr:BamA/TamA family outer membrane protein [Fodinibius halophilus]
MFFLPIPEAVAQDAGIPDQVWKVRFEGNTQYPAVVLKEQVATEQPTFWEKLSFWDQTGYAINEINLKKDVIRLQNYYRRRGFVNVEVSYRIEEGKKSWKKKVVFEIDEQLPIRIQSVDYKLHTNGVDTEEIQADESFQRVKKKQAYRKGKRYETIRKPEVIGKFTDVFKNLGFAYAQVSVDARIDTSKLAAYVTIKGDLGPRTYINDISVEGAENISKKYVLREGDLKKGERYSLEKLRVAQQELFNHHLFRFVTISIPEQSQDSTLDLQMRVREHKLRSVELMAGFGTEEYLRGQASWKHRNVTQRGHRLTTTAHGSFIEQSFRVDYLFPYIYNTKSSVTISPFGQHLLQNNYELLRAGITNSLIYRYTENLTASGSYEFTKNKELSQRYNSSLPDTTLEYDLSSFQFSGYYNQTLGREQKGWVFQPYLEFSGLFGLASFQFQKLSADVRRFTRLSNTTMLAMRLQGGALYNVPSDSLPNNIRFYLGGTNSVRGWYRQQLGPKRAQTDSKGFQQYIPRGGRAMLGFNIELRQELNFFLDGLGIAFFLDGGQVWHTFHRTNTRPLQFGTGGGLRYESPLGPIRVDIGYKINPTDKDLNRYNGQDFGSAWDRIGIHVSIGQAF